MTDLQGTPLSDMHAAMLLARGHAVPLWMRGIIASASVAQKVAEENGHVLRWRSADKYATCRNRPCIGRLYDEGDGEKWSGSLLWQPCPVTLPMPLTDEQAGEMWDRENPTPQVQEP